VTAYISGEPMKNKTDEKSELKGKDAQAVGEPVEGSFVVREGATARKEVIPSAVDSVTPVRSQLLADGPANSAFREPSPAPQRSTARTAVNCSPQV